MVRPFLLASGLALLWFAQFQEVAVEGDAPVWGIAAVLLLRLLVDFIGAWLVLSVLRLVYMLARLGLIQLGAHRRRDS